MIHWHKRDTLPICQSGRSSKLRIAVDQVTGCRQASYGVPSSKLRGAVKQVTPCRLRVSIWKNTPIHLYTIFCKVYAYPCIYTRSTRSVSENRCIRCMCIILISFRCLLLNSSFACFTSSTFRGQGVEYKKFAIHWDFSTITYTFEKIES